MSKTRGCTIRFTSEGVVLSGAVKDIHDEAEKILRRFVYSGRPYAMKSDAPERIVLERPVEHNGHG